MSGILPAGTDVELIKRVLRDFPTQTPGVYRWAVSAVGFIIFAVIVVTMVKPEVAGYVICAVVFMILLIFILLSIEKASDKAAGQVAVLSWFAVGTLIVGASAIMGSLLFGWPLDLSLSESYNSPLFLARIHEYDTVDSVIARRSVKTWTQSFPSETNRVYSFDQLGLSSDYLLLYDKTRALTVRIPAHGGMMQWSVSKSLDDCTRQYCWGDIGRATLSTH